MNVAGPECPETPIDLGPPIRCLVIGGTTLFRAGLRALIEPVKGMEVVGEGNTLDEGLRHVNSPTDVILLDTLDAHDVVLQTLGEIWKYDTAARVLILTIRGEPEAIRRMVIAGARGVVFKDASADHLLTAIRKVHEGELWVERATTAHIISGIGHGRRKEEAHTEQAKIESLTRRELEVIMLVASGLSNKAIAAHLNISGNTVRHHLTSIFSRLEVPDRLALALYAVRHHLVPPQT